MAGVRSSPGARECYASLDANAPDDYRQLAALLVDDWRARGIRTVGVAGGQGAGKSTLGLLLAAAGAFHGQRVVVLSIDDFYLTKAERERLAAEVHPLFRTRGPPGTHAVPLLLRTLEALTRGDDAAVPRFDKGIDDRAGEATVAGPADIVVVEGWCVGAPPRPAGESSAPINTLERQSDVDGVWRNAIDDALCGAYAELNAALDAILFLRVPGLDAVRRWRLQQEGERPRAQRMTAAEIAHFVAHYERITRRMLAELPNTADVTVELAEDHRIAAVHMARN
ncbi:MAG: kinase [Gammaproteobacteria bacterium]|nr:kinase [Gammaproteobacteria bacterium]